MVLTVCVVPPLCNRAEQFLYPRKYEQLVETGNASTAFLQRKLKLGFPRAARIMDDIEAMGIIGPQEGAKPRKILLTKEEWYERQGRS